MCCIFDFKWKWIENDCLIYIYIYIYSELCALHMTFLLVVENIKLEHCLFFTGLDTLKFHLLGFLRKEKERVT